MTSAAFSRREFITGSTAAAALLLSGRSFAQPTDPTDLSIADAYPLIRAGRLSPVALVDAYVERIRRLDGRLNAFVTVTEERAVARARELETELKQGTWRGPLHGIPVALKDNIDTAGVLTQQRARCLRIAFRMKTPRSSRDIPKLARSFLAN